LELFQILTKCEVVVGIEVSERVAVHENILGLMAKQILARLSEYPDWITGFDLLADEIV
jgi:hypothetical protein